MVDIAGTFNFGQFSGPGSEVVKRRARMPKHLGKNKFESLAGSGGMTKPRKAGGRPTLYFLSRFPMRWEIQNGVSVLVDAVDAGSHAGHSLLPFVTSIDYSWNPGIGTLMTFGKIPARQTLSKELFEITIMGNAGSILHPKWGQGDAKKAAVMHFDDLSDFLKGYRDVVGGNAGLREKRRRGSAPIEGSEDPAKLGAGYTEILVLQAPYENDLSLCCEPLSLNFRRAKQGGSHFGYTYELRLKVWGESEFAVPGFSLDPEVQEMNALEAMNSVLAHGALIADRAEGMIAGNLQTANFLVANAVVGSTQMISNAVTDITDSVSKTARQFLGIKKRAHKTALDGIKRVTQAFQWYNNPYLDPLSSEYKELYGPDGSYYLLRKDEGVLAGFAAADKQATYESKLYTNGLDVPFEQWAPWPDDVADPYVAPQEELDPGEVETYTSKEGDTFESIALYELGGIQMWPIIAELNGGTEAGFLAGRKPLQIGSTVVIPKKRVVVSFGSSGTDDPYLTDYLMGPDGDLVVLNDDFNDVKVVAGPSCVKQGLEHRLTMSKGESKVFPNNGLTHLPGIPFDDSTLILVHKDIKAQFLSDPRIVDFSLIELIDEGNGISVHSRVSVTAGATITLVVPV